LQTFLKFNRWAILWGLAIILLTSLPGKAFPRLPVLLDLFHPDKLIHLFIFGVYVFLQINGLVRQTVFPSFKRNAAAVALIIGLFLSAGTELMQGVFIPGRIGSIYDFIANVAGCFIGWWIYRRF
jgi:glycopeptide antibiotics resistance protein